MKILQVVPYFPPAYAFGGPATVAYHISVELVKRGHEVLVYTTDAEGPESRLNVEPVKVAHGIKVRYMRNLSMTLVRKSNLFITTEIGSRAKEETKEFNIVHLHGYRTYQNIIIQRYARKYNVPYVLQAHGSLPRTMAKQRLKWIYDIFFGYRLLRDASNVIALSQIEARQYRSMGVPLEKIAVIPNGIDLSEYEDLPPKGSFKKKFGIPEEKMVILYLGRIHKTKGIDFLIEAYAHLIKSMNCEDALLVIAGPDHGYLNFTRSLVVSLGLADRVAFTGFLTEHEKKCVLVDSSFVVCPSPLEPFGLVALEAAASGKPVIVSNETSMATISKKGEFGFSVDYGNIDELAKIMDIMLSNCNLVSEMGRKGRKFIFENFNWANIVTELEEVYEQVAGGKDSD